MGLISYDPLNTAGGGAFDADGNTLITPSTPIILGQDTGNEAALTLDYTTNKATSGDDTGLLINQTDTDSPGTSKLMDLQVGGVSKFKVSNTGAVTSSTLELTATGTNSPVGVGFGTAASSVIAGFVGSNRVSFTSSAFGAGFILPSDAGPIGFSSAAATSPASVSSSKDTLLYRDAAGTLAQRNGVNAQTFNIYNTYTSGTSYERGSLKWDADTFVIGTEAGSAGGTVRGLSLDATSIGLYGVTPAAQAAHIADATDATDVITRVNAILAALENIGITAAV